MDFDLKNKKVFISGSSKGIGYSIARKFLEEGAKLVINARSKKELKLASTSLDNCKFALGDVSDPSKAKKVIKEANYILKGIDIIVCNVGNGKSVSPGKETYTEWQKVFSQNFFSATNLIEASKNYLEKSQGSIVCISSICGIETIPNAPVTYSVAKSALNSYVKAISLPLAKKGIRINAVAPGNINFEGSVWSKKIKQNPKAVKKMLEDNVPLEKFGSPEDISNAVLWLSSGYANFVSGSVFISDGGQTRS